MIVVRLSIFVRRVLGAFLVVLFSLLVLDVLWQVVSRYALGAPASFTDEVARIAFMWLSFLGAAYVASEEGHLAIDLLPSVLSDNRRRRLEVGLRLLSLSFVFFVFGVGGASLVKTSFELGQRSPVLGVPLGVVYSVVPLSGALFMLFLLGRGGSSKVQEEAGP